MPPTDPLSLRPMSLLLSIAQAAFLLAAVVTAILVLCGMAVNVTDRGRHWEPSLAEIGAWLREWAAHLVILPLFPFGMIDRPPRPAPNLGRPQVPVLLVHGFAMNASCFFPLAWWLQRKGWVWAHSINHRPFSSPIPVFARNLAGHVEALKKASGAAQIDIVAHSMGGVVAAYFINQMQGDKDVRRLITVGTPWRGTKMSVWARRREARDMHPDSPVIADVQAPRVPVVAFYSNTDHLVIPGENALTDGVTGVLLPNMGHLDMILNPRVWPRIAAALDAPEPRP